MAVVRELITRFAFDADTKKVNDFDKGLASVAKTAKIAAAAVTAVAAAAFGLANSAAKAGDEIAKTSRRIGFGTKELQEYRFALGQLGVSQSAVDTGLGVFVRTLGQVADKGTGPAADSLNRLGIEILDTNNNLRASEEIFRDVLKAIGSLNSEAEKSSFANDLFGRGGQAFTLAGDIEQVDRLIERFNELGVAISVDQALISEEFVDSMDELRRIFVAVKNEIGFALLPNVLALVNGFKEWFLINRDIISLAFNKTLQPIVSTFKAVSFLINEVAKGFNSLDIVVKTAIIAFAALGFAIIAPWLPLIFLIGLALLAIDDFVNFFQGNDSVVGRVLEGWKFILQEIIRLINRIPGINIQTRADTDISDDLLTPSAAARLRGIEEAGGSDLLTPGAIARLQAGGMVRDEAADISAAAVSSSNRTITVDSTVNVSVPEGTSKEMRESAREQGRLGAMEGFEQILRQAQNEFPVVE